MDHSDGPHVEAGRSSILVVFVHGKRSLTTILADPNAINDERGCKKQSRRQKAFGEDPVITKRQRVKLSVGQTPRRVVQPEWRRASAIVTRAATDAGMRELRIPISSATARHTGIAHSGIVNP